MSKDRELSKERVQKSKKRQLDSLMKDIQSHSIIKSKALAFRLRELSTMLEDKSKADFVSIELFSLSEELIKIAEQGEVNHVNRNNKLS